jgi:carbon-monoxide dehydrogenase medium subunit
VILTFDDDRIKAAAITIGAVAPVIVHAVEAEEFLHGRKLDSETIEKAAELSKSSARPIDDIRSSGEYRLEMVRSCVKRTLETLARGEEKVNYPKHPVLLRTNSEGNDNFFDKVGSLSQTMHHRVGISDPAIETTVNDKNYKFQSGYGKSLLRLLREEAD